VDDDLAVREAIKEFLLAYGLDAAAYGSAEEFLNSDLLPRTACLITDLNMRGMSGLQLIERVAELGFQVPAIVITGYPEERSRAEAHGAGVIGFFPKPVKMPEVLACLKQVLKWDPPK